MLSLLLALGDLEIRNKAKTYIDITDTHTTGHVCGDL